MVLYVFVVAYVGGDQQSLAPPSGTGMKWASAVFAGALLVEFSIAILGSGLSFLDSDGSGFFAGFGSPRELGKLLLTRFLLAFEVASFLLLIAAVGAVILARRRAGLDVPEGTLSVADLLNPPKQESGTDSTAPRGSMLEAGGHNT